MKPEAHSTPCPCGSSVPMQACCGRYLFGAEPAPTPEALMRSRYTAFATGSSAAILYLVATHHSDHQPPQLERALTEGMQGTRWTSLTVRNVCVTGDLGMVEFVARYRREGRPGEMHETSQFVREKGLWFYTEGS